MGIPDRSLFDLLEKARSWIRCGGNHLISDFSREFWIPDNNSRMCSECQAQFTEFSMKCRCQGCGRVLCEKCMQETPTPIVVASDGGRSMAEDEERIKFCKFCFRDNNGHEAGIGYDERIDPSPQLCSERALPSDQFARFLEFQLYNSPPHVMASNSGHPSPVSFHHSSSRSDEDAEDSGKHFLSPSSEYCGDISDIESNSISARHWFYSFKSASSSPFDSPCRMTSTPNRAGYSVQQDQEGSPLSQNDARLDQETMAVLRRSELESEDLENTDDCSDDLLIFRDQCEKAQQPLDFENNGRIWFPPPPDDEEDEMESNFFEYYDEDDDVGDSSMMFSSCSIDTDTFAVKDKPHEEHKEPLRAVVHGHFRALVLQLLQGEGIYTGNESGGEGWLDIVTSIAWQAANFVKPDTSRGGSMDPGDYVKVKCIVSGSPCESTLIKGVVCTKNIKHKRMTTQYKNPRLLLLGGALEYQRASNLLASFDTLLQQEIDHLKMIVSKIEAHRPNVLLVEKSVSSYAQEYLLAKEISLVLNVKRPLLERIARCTGALVVPSIDNLSSARLGHCEIFRLERVLEETAIAHQPNKKLAKTLMFFEGCPRRLGCTVLLKGTCHEVLKKVKHVVQFAVFAAYHLSLETSFLADEGASLPKMPLKLPVSILEKPMNTDGAISMICNSDIPSVCLAGADNRPQDLGDCSLSDTSSFHISSDVPNQNDWTMEISSELQDSGVVIACSGESHPDLVPHFNHWSSFSMFPSQHESFEGLVQENEGRTFRNHMQISDTHERPRIGSVAEIEDSSEYFSTVDNHQSILVSFSSRCVLKGTLCERSQLFRIKFYGSFDKPLGRYLRDDLFDQTFCCQSCKEPTDAHVHCYTHQQGSLTINVRRLPSLELPGERDGKIWMWHRCLKCPQIDGVPPATRRVVMSDAAWGLSFGKFLELSFSNHATANRVASCGHSLQRDCLRYYGYGSMVAFFRYSPIDILFVRLPPSMLEFNIEVPQEWVKREATELSNRIEVLYAELSDVLRNIEQKGISLGYKHSEASEFHNHIVDLKDLVKKERSGYQDLLLSVGLEDSQSVQTEIDILEVNRLRRCLLIDSYIWDCRLNSLDSLLQTVGFMSKVDSCMLEAETYAKLKEWRDESFFKDSKLGCASEEKNSMSQTASENTNNHLRLEPQEEPNLPSLDPISKEPTKMDQAIIPSGEHYGLEDHKHELNDDGEVSVNETSYELLPSPASSLSDKIDSAWTGTIQQPAKDGHEVVSVGLINQMDSNSSYRRRLMTPMRVCSFDSALRIQERIHRGLSPSSLHLSKLRSFHASGDYRAMLRDPVRRNFPQTSPRETQKLNLISSVSHIAGEGVRLLLPQTGHNKIVIPVYDNEPTSVISYALGSKEYDGWIGNKFDVHEGGSSISDSHKEDDLSNLSGYHSTSPSTFSAWQSFGSLDSEDFLGRSYGSDDASSTMGNLFLDSKKSPHFRISFGDVGKVKFSVTCYFARQFDALRKKCCPSEVDFIRSLSRCNRWNAQGGKSNVYFAKSLDERFIIKQVTKTELDSFEEFAQEYFKYLTDSLSSGSPTCLAKVLGIYQVTVKHLKGGRETKMDVMVMENLFFRRNISRVYDLKGSARSRYNPDTTGKNNVLLDMNLLETLRTNPMFLSSKAKRSLERAVWNDTFFLASVDVMDYSLLVGVDDERKELVLGIIDYMRQYTWDKHLETWVKASGILGGPKNASPTVISPKQYKKRFRKAMSNYFLTVPDQWSS